MNYARTRVAFSCAAMALGTWGCASGPPQSGFLLDYAGFEKLPHDAPVWEVADASGFIRTAPRMEVWSDFANVRRMGDYDRILVDTVVVKFHKDAGKPASPERLNDLTRYMRESLIAALEDRYPVASEPGPGVLRFRTALTELRPIHQFEQKQSVAGQVINTLPGGASFEGEAVDSISGERVAALVGRSRGGRWAALDEQDLWKQTRQALDGLAKYIRLLMDQAHDQDAQP